MARGLEPSVARPALQRASEAQTRLFRAVGGLDARYLPDTQGPCDAEEPDDKRRAATSA